MNNFRSVEFWKESIVILPDNNFFELVRTVFGKIKTPFNKQVLVNDLEKFLLRNDIKENIAAYINIDDARIIAAVNALNEPAPGDLEAFFSGELSYSELHDILVNLEERFIIYRFFEKPEGQKPGHKPSPGRLALNPVLEPILSPFASDKTLLFSSLPLDGAPVDDARENKKEFLFDDRIIVALLSFVSQNRLFFRTGRSIRQKVINAANALFPGLPLETIIGSLQVLGLFFAEEEVLAPDHQRFAAFGELERKERLVYCAAGILCYADFKENMAESAFSPWVFRAKVRNYADTINRLYNSLDPQRLYPNTTLRKLVHISENTDFKHDSAKIIDVMEKIGLLNPVSESLWRKIPCEEASAKESPEIVMDTPSTILVYPEIAYNDVLTLAAFSDVIEAGMTVRFELSRDSVVSAFNRGFSAATIIELLQRLSHNRIDENLLFTLGDWEKRHGEVILRKGLVLTLAPDQCHLAQTRPLAKLIAETLAPGVFLLPESMEDKAVQALHKAGVTIIARRGKCEIEDTSLVPSGSLRHFFQSLHAGFPLNVKKSSNLPADTEASLLIEKFHSILTKMSLGREEGDELSARIKRRLVLCESQLKDAFVRYEKLEARGLDYVGKAMIAKQAVSMQSPVELVFPSKGQQERIFGIPRALEKTEGDSILVIGSADDGDSLRIPLGKISVLRRIKKSIFEGG